MDWNDLKFFTAVYRANGLTGAARTMGVSVQTVGRRITALEAALGTALFMRHTTGYLPTEEAHALIQEAERVEEAVARLGSRTDRQTQAIAGTVRLAAPETLATHILLPALKPTLERHPKLELELVTGVASVGIARGEADLALRVVAPKQGALTVRKLCDLDYGLYCAPDLEADLSQIRLIGWPAAIDLPNGRWLQQATGRTADIRLNHLEAHHAAIRAGIGAGILPRFLSDGLKPISTSVAMRLPLYLVTHDLEHMPLRIRTVHDALVQIIADHRSRLQA